MFSTLKKILVQGAVGANVMAALLLLVCGLTSYVNPSSHPRLSLFCLGFPVLLVLNVAFVFFWLVFQIRKVWLPFVGMLFSAPFIYMYCPINWPRKKPDGALKLLTYNVASFSYADNGEDGSNPLLDYLTGSDADIICLQEARPMKNVTQKELDKAMKDAGYTQARTFGEGRQQLYTRLPVISSDSVHYQSVGNSSVAVRLLYEGDTVLFVNNHLESYRLTAADKQHYKAIIKDPERPEAEDDTRALVGKMAKASRARGPQVDSVMQYIRQAGNKAVVVCGDFNDAPVSYTCQRFSSVLHDAYRQSGNGLGLSYVEKGFYFRLDHVFVSDYWQTYETSVDKGVSLSDHYPLVTYLVKRKK